MDMCAASTCASGEEEREVGGEGGRKKRGDVRERRKGNKRWNGECDSGNAGAGWRGVEESGDAKIWKAHDAEGEIHGAFRCRNADHGSVDNNSTNNNTKKIDLATVAPVTSITTKQDSESFIIADR